MIEQGVFKTRSEVFSPSKVFQFIFDIFSQHAKISHSKLELQEKEYLKEPEIESNENDGYERFPLPERLFGD